MSHNGKDVDSIMAHDGEEGPGFASVVAGAEGPRRHWCSFLARAGHRGAETDALVLRTACWGPVPVTQAGSILLTSARCSNILLCGCRRSKILLSAFDFTWAEC